MLHIEYDGGNKIVFNNSWFVSFKKDIVSRKYFQLPVSNWFYLGALQFFYRLLKALKIENSTVQ